MLPLNTNQVPQLYRNAVGLMQAGKADEAIRAFETLKQLAPERGEFDFHIGQILAAQTRFKTAAAAFSRALALAPGEMAVWQAFADAVAAQGDAGLRAKARKQVNRSALDGAAKQALRKRIATDRTRSTRSSKGLAPETIRRLSDLIEAEDFAAAEAATGELTGRHPDSEILWMIRGCALAGIDRADEAETAFRTALKIDPEYAEAHAYFGEFLAHGDRRRSALEHLQIARRTIPQAPVVLGNLGRVLGQLGRFGEAIGYLDQLLERDPSNRNALMTRASAHLNTNKVEQAGKDMEKLAELGESSRRYEGLKAELLSRQGRTDEALAGLEQILDANPQDEAAISEMAGLLRTLGDFKAAGTLLAGALERRPESPELLMQITRSQKLKADDPLLARMEKLFDQPETPDRDRGKLGFALAKSMEDSGQHDRIFYYLETACELMREAYPYDIASDPVSASGLRTFYDGFDPARVGTVGNAGYRPIFVTGMPRSGTTLVEQILASHSDVTGGGETAAFSTAITPLLKQRSKGLTVQDATDAQLLEIGQAYQAAMQPLHPDTERVTDKSILVNHQSGLVWLALPDAKMVVLRRDPRDNLFSIYKNRFANGTHLYSYSQSDLVDVYRDFDASCDYWRAIAPDRFYEISYEALVADPETEVRRLLEFCELEWQDSCLSFHKTERRVNTLSQVQVRQPLYSSSVAAWRRHEKDLAVLLDGLKDLLPEDDGATG